MHIEPGVVDGAKIALGYATGGRLARPRRQDGGATRSEGRRRRRAGRRARPSRRPSSSRFFELLPHHPVGVSEVHLILGSTLFLIFGAGPAAIGLALGLLVQGLFFAPFDLPQYGMNVTTLIVPLFAMSLARPAVVPAETAYVDVKYRQALALSTTYQGGIVAWVAFWALYGHGFAAANLAACRILRRGLHDGDHRSSR